MGIPNEEQISSLERWIEEGWRLTVIVTKNGDEMVRTNHPEEIRRIGLCLSRYTGDSGAHNQ